MGSVQGTHSSSALAPWILPYFTIIFKSEHLYLVFGVFAIALFFAIYTSWKMSVFKIRMHTEKKDTTQKEYLHFHGIFVS